MGPLSTLQKRILSAAVLGPLTIGLIILGGVPFYGLIAVGAIISLYEFHGMEKRGAHPRRNMLLWIFYISICAYAFITLRAGFPTGLHLVMAVMLTVWASDIGAYFTGKAIGGPKLAPQLSPKKTWAGLVGGMVCSGLTLLIYGVLAKSVFWAHPAILFISGFGFGAVGQAGDLLISAVKRRVGVKDTGHIIPGHGGLLDRIDSLLLVVPVFLAAFVVWL